MLPQDTHVFLIAFSLMDRDAFENVKTLWMPECKEYLKNAQVGMEYLQLNSQQEEVVFRCASISRKGFCHSVTVSLTL